MEHISKSHSPTGREKDSVGEGIHGPNESIAGRPAGVAFVGAGKAINPNAE